MSKIITNLQNRIMEAGLNRKVKGYTMHTFNKKKKLSKTYV